MELSRKKMFFIFTKTDELKKETQLNDLIKKIKLQKNQKIFFLSNKTKKGLNVILSAIEKVIAEGQEEKQV